VGPDSQPEPTHDLARPGPNLLTSAAFFIDGVPLIVFLQASSGIFRARILAGSVKGGKQQCISHFDHVVKRYTADVTVVRDFNGPDIKTRSSWCWWARRAVEVELCACFAGLESITEGQIRIGDRVVNNVAARTGNIADGCSKSYALTRHIGACTTTWAFPLQMQHN